MLKKALLFASICLFALVGAFGISSTRAYAQSQYTQENSGYGKNVSIISYDNYLLVADTDNNRIRIVEQDSLLNFSFGKKGYLDENTTNPTLLACDNQYIYIVMGNNDFIKVFDYSGNYQSLSYDSYNNDGQSITFNQINSIVKDAYGDMYLLHIASDIDQSSLLKLTDQGFATTDIQNIEYKQNSKLLVSTSGQRLIVVDSKKVYTIDTKTMTVSDSYDIDIEFDDVKVDYLDNLYFFNKSTNTITKLSSADFSTITQTVLDAASNGFAFNQMTGETFVLDNATDSIVKLDQTFVEDLSDFQKPTDYLDTDNFTQGAELAILTNTAIAYNYPYTLSSCMTLAKNSYVIVLDDSQDFWYCMVTTKANYNQTVYINKSHLSKVDMSTFEIAEGNYIISTPQAIIYKYPTSLKATSTASNSISLATALSSGSSIKATKLITGYSDYQNMSFFEIELEDGKVGYVTTASIMTFNTTKDPQTIKANATIKITSELAFVNLYTKVGDKYQLLTTQVLLDGTRIRLVNNYDKQAQYTEIKYIDNQGQVSTAYVETKFIILDGITFEIVIAILLVVVSVVLGLILIVVIKKSKHRV